MSSNIHKTALIEKGAQIGQDVTIGPYTIVNKHVVIGDKTVIGSNCELGILPLNNTENPLIIGEKSLIRSHSIFYSGSIFGPNLITGHRVTVREGTKGGANLQIGTLGDIQGTCEIGDYVRMHSKCHIAQHTKIGNFVWLFPNVITTNDRRPPSTLRASVVIEDYVAISTGSVVLPGVTIKKGTLIGANSLISKDTKENTVVVGNPARELCNVSELKLKDGSDKQAYPWRRHFHEGYPVDIVNDWKAEFDS